MIYDKHGNGIYELTDEEKDLIKKHDLFYADLFEFGNYILENCFKEPIKDYELTIYSMIYRIMELLDTLKVMTENSLINSGFIVLRSLIEIAVQTCYITFDNNKIQEKATVLQMLDIKRTSNDETAFYQYMKNKKCYKNYVSIIMRDKPFPNWYSYCEKERTSIEDLFKILKWDSLYSTLYRPLCIESHEINHMETNIVHVNNRFYFKPFRMFEKHVLLLNSVLTIMVPTLHILVELYGNKPLILKWTDYEKETIEYIQTNHRISEIGKYLDPLQKRF
jgi:hypothetical protein